MEDADSVKKTETTGKERSESRFKRNGPDTFGWPSWLRIGADSYFYFGDYWKTAIEIIWVSSVTWKHGIFLSSPMDFNRWSKKPGEDLTILEERTRLHIRSFSSIIFLFRMAEFLFRGLVCVTGVSEHEVDKSKNKRKRKEKPRVVKRKLAVRKNSLW